MPAPNLDVNALPLVLVGPILRRVTSTSVSVFVVLKEAASVRLEIGTPRNNDFALGNDSEHTIALGAHVHVAVVTCNPAVPLQRGQIYTYHLQFTLDNPGPNPNPVSLFDDGVLVSVPGLAGNAALGLTLRRILLCYGDFEYPTFVLPPVDVNGLQLLHGSCRKPHGGKRDALSIADQILQQTATDYNQRPQQLWLTGDQIYGDDVHTDVLEFITELRQQLFQWTPADDLTRPIPDLSRGRAEYAVSLGLSWSEKANSVVPSDDAETYHNNRLLLFQEYCTMYLIVWSPVLWNWAGPTVWPVSWNWNGSSIFSEVFSFRDELPQVRRALANIATYMIFDDHEITDDLFLNLAWVNKMRDPANPNGLAVVGNGFAAYAIFQHWGNVPDRFTGGGVAETLFLATLRQPYIATRGPTAQDWVEIRSWVLPSLSSAVSGQPYTHQLFHNNNSIRWHYSYCDTSLRFEVLVLDTRTQRCFPNASSNGAGYPGLISQQGIAEMIPSVLPDDVKISIFISPAPFCGVPFIEGKQQDYAPVHNVKEQRRQDAEAWSFDLISYQRLMQRIAERTPQREGGGGLKVVFLSGDVHYGFSKRLQYWTEGVSVGVVSGSFVAAQLTSSALKNYTDDKIYKVFQGGTLAMHNNGFDPFGHRPKVVQVIGWNSNPNHGISSSEPVMRCSANPTRIWAERPITASNTYYDIYTIKIDEQPSLLAYGPGILNHPPDWEFRIDHFEVFPPAGAPLPQHVNADPRRWQKQPGMQCVGVPNIGRVRFGWQDDDLFDDLRFVFHDLWWRRPDQAIAAPHSQYGIPLGATYVNNTLGVEFPRPSDRPSSFYRLMPSQGR